ncbi:MAG TPA: Rrf2 family transcriptional regulator [Tabrizicola sp.]|nr:Rrf2 family transcriptional regulator [Tabrizicola sp.]
MKRDSKLSLALHILGHMGAAPDEVVQSETLAAFHATHAVVVRRTLGRLRAAGLVSSARGHAGGWRLALDPARISVADVYRALGERLDGAPGAGLQNPATCAVERALHGAWDDAVALAEAALLDRLSGISIAELSSSMACGLAAMHQHGSP